MRKFTSRIVICLVPLLIAGWIVGWSFWDYVHGKGGFKLGVDLVGGTILIYEVDLDKLPNGKLPVDWNPQEVARRLKSRIDPGDLYNITIRVASNTRFEIILPTGGYYQREAQEKAWKKVIEGVEEFNKGEYKMARYVVPVGRTIELLAAINAQYPRRPVDHYVVDLADGNHYVVPVGKTNELLAAINTGYSDEQVKTVEEWIKSEWTDKAEGKNEEEQTKLWDELLRKAEKKYPPVQEWIKAEYTDKTKGKNDAEKTKLWDELLKQADKEFPLRTYVVGQGQDGELATLILQQHPTANLYQVRRLVTLLEQNPNVSEETLQKEVEEGGQGTVRQSKVRRGISMTTEQVQALKELIASQGSLEFVILANNTNDKEAMDAVQTFFKKVKDSPELQKYLGELALQGKPPPITVDNNGRPDDPVFDTPLGKYRYRWIEMGRNYRSENGFANPRDPKTDALLKPPPEKGEPDYDVRLKEWNADERNKKLWNAVVDNSSRDNPSRLWKLAAGYRERGELMMYPQDGRGTWMYSRRDQNVRPTEKDRDKEFDYFLLCRMSEEGVPAITGEDVASAQPGSNEEVIFHMKPYAGSRFRDFTSKNKSHLMAIVLDNYIESSANIESAISTDGRITGMGSPDRVEATVKVLRSGPLQASLKSVPVSENTLGPTLGADTVRWGFISVVAAFGAVLIFMLFYYRFAGVVACVALLANLLLTVAFMVAIDATFTLPGLAGLVLMLGMAVDANVLIYERLREERERGATIAQSLRNGYEHAFPTIIDTHLSSIFTAIVLYVVGNDQLKGFGISLTVGLIISLFTSLYMTRTMFDFWLAKGWLHKLSMASFKHWPGLRVVFGRDINFMSIRYQVFAATAIITVLGAILFIYRLDRGGLNIDFMGGIAYSAELTKPLGLKDLRELLDRDKTGLEGLTVEQTFATGFTDPEHPDRSRLFTVRAETPAEYRDKPNDYLKKVQQIIYEALNVKSGEELLKTIDLSEYQIMPDHREVYMSFVDPKTREPVFASRSQVSMLLNQELRSPSVRLEALAQQMSVTGLGREEESRFQWLKLTFPIAVKDTELSKLEAALRATQKAFHDSPQPERLETFDSQLAADTQTRALLAIVASWCATLLYLWFRFGNWTFGLATVICLIHDLFFTLGVIAASHYFYKYLPGVATLPFFRIEDFKIDLPAVAALLTLVGYSVNDTIVVFDRIREVRGKNPSLTPKMINDAINQTLGRTLLASLTVFLVVVVLYYFGGEGVHLFAFVMVVGVIIGTLSSIYVASPLLLLFGEGKTTMPDRAPARATEAR